MWAVIFNIWRDQPVFHQLDGPLYTKCGRKRGLYTPCLPLKHAEKIGRKCKSCEAQEAS